MRCCAVPVWARRVLQAAVLGAVVAVPLGASPGL